MSKENFISDTVLNDPAIVDGLKKLVDKTSPLIQAGRFDNIVDLLSLVSDNISFLDEAALQKTTKIAEEIMALGWAGGNAVRMANAQTEALENPPGLLKLMSSLNDPDVRRALHFFIGTMRIIGRQMKND